MTIEDASRISADDILNPWRTTGERCRDLVGLMIDGVHFAEHLCVVALGISIDGTKIPLGVVEGSTENATVKALLTDLRERGLDACRPILVVIDGAKALARAMREVFDRPVIQRCQLHYAEQRIMPSWDHESLWDKDFVLTHSA